MRELPWLPMAGSAVFAACWAASALMWPDWRLMEDWPSALGTAASPGRLLFNSGMAFSGVCSALFGISMHNVPENVWVRLEFIVTAAAGALLVGVAVFNDDVPYLHEMCSMPMFTSCLISIIYFGVFLLTTGRLAEGAAAVASVALVACSGAFVPFQAWDCIGTIYITAATFVISLLAWRLRFWGAEEGADERDRGLLVGHGGRHGADYRRVLVRVHHEAQEAPRPPADGLRRGRTPAWAPRAALGATQAGGRR